MFEKLKNDVYHLVSGQTAHNKEHIERVTNLALNFGMKEGADLTIVELIALLHDVDDYKFSGIKDAKELSNVKTLLKKHEVAPEIYEKVIHGVHTIGYSKRFEGIMPDTIEAKVVSDADMCDITGISGIMRLKELADARNMPFFQPKLKPNFNMTIDEYRKNKVIGIQHIFEKVLKLGDFMMTPSGLAEYEKRKEATENFLYHLFQEEHQMEWQRLLSEMKNETFPKEPNAYTVCLLFTPDMEHILLVEKQKTEYIGLLNGVGGKVEENETPEECARREIKEETGITRFRKMKWLGILTLPYDCKEMTETECKVYFYAGIMAELWNGQQEKEPMKLFKTDNILSTMRDKLAGNGDVEYFIKRALKELK